MSRLKLSWINLLIWVKWVRVMRITGSNKQNSFIFYNGMHLHIISECSYVAREDDPLLVNSGRTHHTM